MTRHSNPAQRREERRERRMDDRRRTMERREARAFKYGGAR